jgi:hypothetical protein
MRREVHDLARLRSEPQRPRRRSVRVRGPQALGGAIRLHGCKSRGAPPPDWPGLISLGEFPLDVVRVDCPRCDRAGSYGRDSLMVRFGGGHRPARSARGLGVLRTPSGFLSPMRRAVHGFGRKSTLMDRTHGASLFASAFMSIGAAPLEAHSDGSRAQAHDPA